MAVDEQILTFPINVKAILAHMKQDMRDDWFYDTLKYADIFSNESQLIDTVRSNIELGHGMYQAGGKHIYDVPKSSYGLRYSLEIDFYDRFLYQAICSYLIKFYDPLISKRVLSHRFDKHRSREKNLFKSRIELWQTFEGVTRLGINEGSALLVTDLINYYEHISINNIDSAFISLLPRVQASGSEKNQIRSAIYTLIALLRKWCFNDNHGLPQNRDASSFIANIVLSTVDCEMQRMGYDYYRYVDDIRIICNDELHARKALNDLISELRKFGMNINSKKTDILTSASTTETVSEFFPGYDDRSLAIDNMWRSRSKKVIARSIPLLTSMLKEILDSNDTQSRQFRFCINRFKSLIATNVFDAKSLLANEIATVVLNHLIDQPVSTDQFCKLLAGLDLRVADYQRIEDFITNELVAIFHWQNFNLWLLLAHKKFRSDRLVAHAVARCTSTILDADIPACFIYLAAVGEEAAVENLIPIFESTWPYQHQRFFLVALQNSSAAVLKPLISKMTIQLTGTIKRIRSNKRIAGTFVSEYDVTSFTQIYDELNPYE